MVYSKPFSKSNCVGPGAGVGSGVGAGVGAGAVSYTHLTLPTKA